MLSLVLALLILGAGIAGTKLLAGEKRASDYEVRLEAARLMDSWMEAIKEYKLEAGLEVTEEDIHGTGLLGAPYTFITTTHGAVEAKRTTCNPDMAALMVQMLDEAGLRSGDTAGAGFSGSFPALNLAVLAACQTMGIRCIYIASIGASTYGANQPEMTFPDMAYRLCQDGLLDTPPALVTPGGRDDCGLDMDEQLRETALARIASYGAEIMREPDFETNMARRMELYDTLGPIQCFIGVGGNLTTTGGGENEVPYGLIPAGKIRAAGPGTGLLQRYSQQGIPVIHLLNVKQLTADCGLPYDPEVMAPPGESAVYYETDWPLWCPAAAVILACAVLAAGFRRKRNGEEAVR